MLLCVKAIHVHLVVFLEFITTFSGHSPSSFLSVIAPELLAPRAPLFSSDRNTGFYFSALSCTSCNCDHFLSLIAAKKERNKQVFTSPFGVQYLLIWKKSFFFHYIRLLCTLLPLLLLLLPLPPRIALDNLMMGWKEACRRERRK